MYSRIAKEMPVLSADGLVVGKVSEVSDDGIVIDGGNVVHGALRVERGAVSGVFAGEVYLRKRAAELAPQPEAPQPFV